MGKTVNLKINVTEDHIKKSKKESTHHCMISEACLEAGAIKCSTHTGRVRFMDIENEDYYMWFLPKEIWDKVKKWDKGEEIEPFHFTVPNVPTKLLKRK